MVKYKKIEIKNQLKIKVWMNIKMKVIKLKIQINLQNS